MAGIGTAARNWEEEEKKKEQQGIGTAAYHEPAGSIGTPAYHEPAGSIGTPAYHEPAQGIGTPASNNLNQAAGQPINVMEGVTDATRQKLGQAQAGYQQTSAAQQAQAALQQLQAQKPQGYTSKYGAQLEGILQELQGKKFNYSLNGDAFFNALKDSKMQAAKQASLDAMGQAAGLTGGYGNSAAQLAANQVYQQNLLSLNDDAMDAYRLALQQFQMEQQGMGDQFGRLLQMENADYGKYRDTVSDFNTERGYLTDLYNTEEERGYNRYMNDLDYYTKLAQIENADYRSEQERQEAIRQFQLQYEADQSRFNWQKDVDQRDYDRGVLESDRNYALQQQQLQEQIRQFEASLDWDKMSAQQKYAADYAIAILQNGQMPSEELLQAAGLSAEDAAKLMAKISSGGTTGKKTTTTSGDWDLPTAGLNVWLSDPANKETIQKYAQQATAKDVNSQLRNGQLPSAAEVAAAGMNQTDVMKQYMKNTTPANPTAEELMRIRLLKGGK